MKSIVIATDGSASAAEAVAFGLELATEQGAEVTFVHVLPPDDFFVAGRGGPALPKPHHVEMDKSETALKEAADAAEEAGVSYALERISGDTVDEIVAVADARDADYQLRNVFTSCPRPEARTRPTSSSEARRGLIGGAPDPAPSAVRARRARAGSARYQERPDTAAGVWLTTGLRR